MEKGAYFLQDFKIVIEYMNNIVNLTLLVDGLSDLNEEILLKLYEKTIQ